MEHGDARANFSFPSHSHCQALTAAIAEELPGLRERLVRRHYERDAVLYLMGGPTREIYFVLEGQVKLCRSANDGREIILGLYGAGDIFGELCFCQVRARQEHAIAMMASSVATLSAGVFLDCLRTDVDRLQSLIAMFCSRLAETENRLADLSLENVRTRLAKLLAALGRPAEDGRLIVAGMTHENLAQLVVASRELTTKLLNDFRREGLIAYERQGSIELRPGLTARPPE